MTTNPTFQFADSAGEDRLRELILYVAIECQDDPNFGAVKLNKILWWSDFLSYAQLGKPITGVEYMRLNNGPVPKRLKPIRDRMRADGDLVVSSVPTLGGYVQQRVVALRPANLSNFSAEQIAVVGRVIKALWHRTATGVSTLSHGKAWEVAPDHGSIPYEAVFLSDKPVTRYDITRTKELGRELGWTFA